MSIFKRGPDLPSGARVLPVRTGSGDPAGPASECTLIALGTTIEGSITGKTAVRIEGTLKGEIHVTALLEISADGRVEGQVRAREARIAGSVIGSVHCTERIEIAATGSVDGEVRTPRLAIVEGGFLKGDTKMEPAEDPERDRSESRQRS